MGASQTETKHEQSTTTANPTAIADITPIANMGVGIANTPYNVGMNTNVAGLNPQQLAAIQGLGGLQTNNPANSYINQAALYSNQAADPNNVINMQKAFYNPMSDAVIKQMQNVFGQQGAQVLGNAAASGAIGGSRAPIAAENLINQQDLALGQTLSGLQQQALNAAQTQQGQISQQAFTQGQLGQEALNTQIQGINQALLGGNITQQQAQALLNAAQQNVIQQTLFPGQMAATGMNIAQGALPLGSSSTGESQTTKPVDYTGMILGALGAGAGAYMKSDERVKENVQPIGKSFDKQTIYKFNYIGDPVTRIGLMAQEVEKKHPSAVKNDQDGTKSVDYSKATAKSAEMGQHRQHRAIGGGTGIGLGGFQGGSGISSAVGLANGGLQPYFAQIPQVHVQQPNFPTLNLEPSQNAAQNNQQSQQANSIGSAIGNMAGGSPTDGGLSGGIDFGGDVQPLSDATAGGFGDALSGAGDALAGAGSAIAGGIGDVAGAIGSGIGDLFASGAAADFLPALFMLRHGGSVRHRPFGGLVQDGGDPDSIQAANDAFLANNQGFGLGANLIPSANAATPPHPIIEPAPLPRNNTLRDYLADRQYGVHSVAAIPSEATEMGALSPTPGPHQYIERDFNGRLIGGPRPAEDDPALVQRAPPIQQAAIGPAQTPPPISSPQQPIDRVALGPNTQMPPLALDVIKSNEGFSPNAQWDYKQYSGGYGTRAQPGQTYTPESAQKDLLEQTAPLHDFISQNVHVPLTQRQYAGLADFGHNLGVGPGGLTDLLPDINRGDWARVAQRMQHYNQAGGQVLDGLVQRRAMDGALVQNQDVAVNPPAISGDVRRSVLDRPDLQPPKPGDSYIDKTLASFGMGVNKRQDIGDLLLHGGLAAMAAGPTVGLKGPGVPLIGALKAAGIGGQAAFANEAQERQQAINLANAAMNQRLHDIQAQHQQFEMKKPFQIGSSVVYMRDPVTQQPIAHTVTNYGTMDPSTGKISPLSEEENMRLNGISGIKGQGLTQAEEQKPVSMGEEARKELAESDPMRMRQVQSILDGKAAVPTGRSRTPNDIVNWDWANRISNGQVNASTYPAVAAAQKKLSAGPWADVQVAANKAVNHATDLVHNIPGLGNTGSSWYNSATGLPEEQNPWATRYQSALAGLRTNKNGLAGEVAKVFKGTGATAEKEIEAWKSNFSEYSSPTQMIRSAQESMHMMMGQLDPLAEKIDQELHKSPGDAGYMTGRDLMSPAARDRYDKIMSMDAEKGASEIERVFGKGTNSLTQEHRQAPAQQAAPQSAPAGKPVPVSSIEEAMKLPSGTHFITPDGREKVRP